MSLSPSARAARAMAVIASREGAALSPRARAAAVWSVMPQVYQGDLDVVAPSARDSGDTARAEEWAETRPGLGALAGRAGEALGSFVAPQGAELATAGGRRGEPLAQRAGAPVYVDTGAPAAATDDAVAPQRTARPGRAYSQVGGGEPEIPAWFESAARKMLEERSGSSGGMSLAELVLVTAVPQKQIAASAKSASASSHAGHAHHGAGKGKGEDKKPDVHKLAEEVYAEILKLIDTARERSGDPYQ
jgi:hypothetical protein